MTQINISQKSFSVGEISPDLEGRTDLEKYNNALSTSLNVMCTNKGDLIPRPGTEYVSLTPMDSADISNNRANKKARLIPLKVSEDSSYMLEFSHRKMRVFKDSKPLVGSNETIRVSVRSAPVITAVTASIGMSLPAGSELAEFSFLHPNKFSKEAGDGPFYFEWDEAGMQGDEFKQKYTGTPDADFSFRYKSSTWPGKSTSEYDSDHAYNPLDRFWVHSVKRNSLTSTALHSSSAQRSYRSSDQVADIVYITDSPANVGIEGAQLLLVSNRSANEVHPDFSWTFTRTTAIPTGGASPKYTFTPLDYFDSPFEESEIFDMQYASYADQVYFTHKNKRPMKLKRIGDTNFSFNKFYFQNGPWRESSTYGEGWQGHSMWSVPSALNPNPVGNNASRYPPFSDGELQVATGSVEGKQINIMGSTVSIYLTDGSPSIKTSSSGFTADEAWIGRQIRIKMNVGQNPGLTKFAPDNNLTVERNVAIDNDNGEANNAQQGFRPYSYETTSYLWAEGEVLGTRHTSPISWTSDPPGADLLFKDANSRLYVGSNKFLTMGDVISLPLDVSTTTYPKHSVVVTSETEPRVLAVNEWYIHSIPSITEVLICDSFAKIGVAGQEHTTNYNATSGLIIVENRGVPNPARQLRLKITVPFAFTGLPGGFKEDFAWLKPSADHRVGHLFEAPMPDGTGGWPKTVEIFDNRLFFGASNEFPSMIAASAAGDFDNFSPDDGGSNTVQSVGTPESMTTWSIGSNQNPRIFPTDSFTYSLQEGTSDPINWMKATPHGLVISTNNAIYMSEKPQRNEGYGPNNWKMKLISEEGSSKVIPEYIDGRLYYINSRGDKLLSLQYSTEADAFKPVVESILSEHMLKDGVKCMAFARSPIQVLWLVLNNGDMVSVVLLDTEEQKGFFKHRLASPSKYARGRSTIHSVAVIPSENKKLDQLWVSVERRSIHPSDTPDIADTEGNINTLEKLTQYSPYLSDTKDFVGLDLSITSNSERLRNGNGYKIIDIDLSKKTSGLSTTPQIKIETDSAHGIADDAYFLITELIGGLSYLNHGALHQAESASNGSLLYADYRIDPLSIINKASGTTADSINQSSKHPYIIGGLLSKRTSTINFIGELSIGNNPANPVIAGGHSVAWDGAYFERGSKFLDFKKISDQYADGTIVADPVLTLPSITSSNEFGGRTYSPQSDQGYSFVLGFKPEIYFTTLPPVLNNQLGDMDLNYVHLSSVTVDLSDSHQIRIRHFGDSVADEQDLIDDSFYPSLPSDEAIRSSGRYSVRMVQKEEDSFSKISFYPEEGYPFMIKSISLRGERSNRS